MYATVFKLCLFALTAWIAYAYLTGHPSKDFVTRTIKRSSALSKSRTTLIIWWSLIGTGAVWLLYDLLK
jgi:hypothetical protein